MLWGGAGSGKSVAAAQKFISRAVQEPGVKFLFVRKVRSTIENSSFALAKQVIEDFGVSGYVDINRTTLTIQFRNGSSIIMLGLDDPEKLKSIVGLSGVWFEEATEGDEDDVNQLNLRLRGRTPYYKQIVLTFNPISELHWIKRKYFDEKHEDVFTLHTNYKDNAFLDDEYIKELEERFSFDENYKRVYVDGVWGRLTTGSLFYSHFSFKKHVGEVDYVRGAPLHISFDFNVNPYMPMGIFQVLTEQRDRKVYLVRQIDEIANRNPLNTTEALCKTFLERWGGVINEPVYVYGDAHGKARSPYVRMNHYDIISRELKGLSLNYRILPKNPRIERRRIFMNKVFSGTLPIEVLINERCKLSLNDFAEVIESQDKSGNVQKHVRTVRDKVTGVSYEETGHFSDLWDYFMCGCFESYFLNI